MTTNLDRDTLEWAAQWIEGSLKGEPDQRVREFAKNMAMTLRAATTPPAVTEPWRDEGGHAWEVRHNVTCVECPHCCFIFAAVHTDGYSNGYSCPNCEGCPDAVTKAGEDDPES